MGSHFAAINDPNAEQYGIVNEGTYEENKEDFNGNIQVPADGQSYLIVKDWHTLEKNIYPTFD